MRGRGTDIAPRIHAKTTAIQHVTFASSTSCFYAFASDASSFRPTSSLFPSTIRPPQAVFPSVKTAFLPYFHIFILVASVRGGVSQSVAFTANTARIGCIALFADFIRMKLMATHKDHESVLEAERVGTRPPPLYKVLLLNDDFTPMEFVVLVLQKFFSMSSERATQIMLQVHRKGSGVCGVFPKDVAATKVEQVVAFAQKHQHPLACVMEES